MATLGEAFKYPFMNGKRLFYSLWILIPILGFLAFIGYGLRIVRNVGANKKEGVPEFGSFWDNVKGGFIVFVLLFIINIVAELVRWFSQLLGTALLVMVSLISPIVVVHYAISGKFGESLNLVEIAKMIFLNFKTFLPVFLKSLIVSIVWVIPSIIIITMIITLPAMMYSHYFLYSDWYREITKA